MVSTKCPRWLTPNISSNPCLVSPRVRTTPALFTSTCNGSSRARNEAAQARTESRSARSSGRYSTASFPVDARRPATAAAPFSADRLATYTRPPRRASPSAVARPIPVLAPVTRNVRPASSLSVIIRSLCLPARLQAPAVGVFPRRSSQAPRAWGGSVGTNRVQTPTRPSARGSRAPAVRSSTQAPQDHVTAKALTPAMVSEPSRLQRTRKPKELLDRDLLVDQAEVDALAVADDAGAHEDRDGEDVHRPHVDQRALVVDEVGVVGQPLVQVVDEQRDRDHARHRHDRHPEQLELAGWGGGPQVRLAQRQDDH